MATLYNPRIVTDGLVLALDAGNAKSYAGSGTTWFDISGNGQSPSVSGLSFNTNCLGAINMPNGNELLTIVPASSLVTTLASGDFSIETVVKSTNAVYPRSRHPMYIARNPTNANEKGWSVGHGVTSTQLEVRVCDGTTLVNGFISHTVQESTIYHRTFTVSRTSGVSTNYYVNSVFLGQVNAPGVTGTIYNSGNLVFGNVWGWRYIGDLYSFKVFNRVLSATEIQQNYNATRSRFGV